VHSHGLEGCAITMSRQVQRETSLSSVPHMQENALHAGIGQPKSMQQGSKAEYKQGQTSGSSSREPRIGLGGSAIGIGGQGRTSRLERRKRPANEFRIYDERSDERRAAPRHDSFSSPSSSASSPSILRRSPAGQAPADDPQLHEDSEAAVYASSADAVESQGAGVAASAEQSAEEDSDQENRPPPEHGAVPVSFMSHEVERPAGWLPGSSLDFRSVLEELQVLLPEEVQASPDVEVTDSEMSEDESAEADGEEPRFPQVGTFPMLLDMHQDAFNRMQADMRRSASTEYRWEDDIYQDPA